MSKSYKYKPGTNQLDHVKDGVPAANYSIDIDNQDTLNYRYDQIGNLTRDKAEGIDTIQWTVYGKIQHIKKTNGTIITYNYDAAGNRISKTISPSFGGVGEAQFYLRDATGNVMSIYTKNDTINNGKLTQSEIPIYGSSRLGVYNADKDVSNPTLVSYADTMLTFTRGKKWYELTDHRGNVLAVVSDKKLQMQRVQLCYFGYNPNGNLPIEMNYPLSEPKPVNYNICGQPYIAYIPDVKAATLYSAYGAMAKSYNGDSIPNAFNGQKRSMEISPTAQTAEFWEYNGDVGRRWNVDPRPHFNPQPHLRNSGNAFAQVATSCLPSCS